MLPTWADFEMGSSPVYWETTTGRAPASVCVFLLAFSVWK
jgi:hypothetical protein